MIKPHPNFLNKEPQSPAQQTEQLPDEKKLKALLDNDLVEVAQRLIDQFKLPFLIKASEDGKNTLESILSAGEQHLNRFITVDPDTLEMKQDSRKMAKTDYEVLITGETGTGKEIIAASMIADRRGKLQAVNCAGFPETLIESELFGYEKGAFTGAETRRAGLMLAAANGVLFLDEVGELPMNVQAKLLRALQEKRIRRVGSTMDEDINCKFVCATHRDLRQMVKEGTFRKDLYARISSLELDINPLRKRMCDVVPITESLSGGKKFIEKYETELNNGLFDLSLNVRSLQQHVIRFNVLGKVSTNK